MTKSKDYAITSVTIPIAIYNIIQTEVKKQKVNRNVNISSFIVEILARELVK